MGLRVFLPLKSASFSTSSPRSPVTVRDCFTFRFVSLGEGGQSLSMLGAKKKSGGGRKAEKQKSRSRWWQKWGREGKVRGCEQYKSWILFYRSNRLTRPVPRSRCTPGWEVHCCRATGGRPEIREEVSTEVLIRARRNSLGQINWEKIIQWGHIIIIRAFSGQTFIHHMLFRDKKQWLLN